MTIYNKLYKPQHGGDKYLKSQHSEGRVRQAGPKFKISMSCTARFKKKKKKSAYQTQYIVYIKQSAISSNCSSCLAAPLSWC